MIYFIFCLIGVVYCKDPMGHMKPLGSHRDPEGHVDILDEMPTPQEFWDKYCSIGKPAVLRGFAKNMPAFSKWTDDYIKTNFGDLMVKLESKYEKDFKPEGDLGMGQDSLKHFIDTYVTDDKYCVSQLPGPMAKDVLVPPVATCGSFRIRLLEANLWLSSGNTRSLLHRDADNAINCLLNGTKDWILIDPKYEDYLPIAVEAGNPYGGFTLLNVNKVNLKKYPKMKKVPWYYANMQPGDCLFLPKGHWHQVRSYGTKNLAVSMLLARLKEYQNIDCPEAGLPKPELLSDMPMVWTYDGYGAQTMGNVDPFELNETFTGTCKYGREMTVQSWEEDLIGALDVQEDNHKGTVEVDPDSWKTPIANRIIMKNRAKAIMKILDPVNGKRFDCKDPSILTVENLKKIADIQDPDPANTKEYEYLHFSSALVKKMIMSSIKNEVVDKDDLMKKYRSREGSKAGVEWIVSVLDENKDGIVTMKEVAKNMQTIVDKYEENNMLKDVSKSSVSKSIIRDDANEEQEEEDDDEEDDDEDEEQDREGEDIPIELKDEL